MTEISLLTTSELRKITKKSGWRFNWNNEFKHPERDIFKLTIINNPNHVGGHLMIINTTAALKLTKKYF